MGIGPSFEDIGGVGRGPVGGGALMGRVDVGNPRVPIWELLLVRGGKKGRAVGSMAVAGSGMLSRLPNSRRFDLLTCPLGASCVSNDKCCSDNGGAGVRWANPVGVLKFGMAV